MDLKCSIIHKHFFFFFFSAAILVPFPNILLFKKNNYHEEAKSEEDKSLCCWGGGGLCLDLGLSSPLYPQHPGGGQLVCANFCRDLCFSLPVESDNGEGRKAVVWVCVVMLLAALHSCGNSSFTQRFPPFWSVKWQPLSSRWQELPPWRTQRPPMHMLASSPSFSSHSSHFMSRPSPFPDGPTDKAWKLKKKINTDTFYIYTYFCQRERAVLFAHNIRLEQKAELQ